MTSSSSTGPHIKIIPASHQVAAPSHVQFGSRLTDVPLGEGLDLDPEELAGELQGYVDILMARRDAPISSPYLDLQECATAYLARALEMEMLIHNEERQRHVIRGHPLYQFRTGTLRSFIEMAKKMADLGSRRLSQEQMMNEMRYDSGGN